MIKKQYKDYLSHSNLIVELRLEGNDVVLKNKITGTNHYFRGGRERYTLNAKDRKDFISFEAELREDDYYLRTYCYEETRACYKLKAFTVAKARNKLELLSERLSELKELAKTDGTAVRKIQEEKDRIFKMAVRISKVISRESVDYWIINEEG